MNVTRASRDVVAHLVDADRGREDERVVLARRDLDPVRVAHAKPALGDLADRVAVALDLVLVVDDVALRLQLAAALDLDLEGTIIASSIFIVSRMRSAFS